MAGTTPNLGLTTWNSGSDNFNYSVLANNWTIIDAQFSPLSVSTVPVRFVESVANVPATNLSNGRLVYLTAADSGFPAKTLLVYAGTFWKPVGPDEYQSTVPVSSNYTGRRVILTVATGPFQQWDTIVNTDGSNTWKRIDNDTLLSTTTFRNLASFPDGFRGLVQADATNGINWNLRNNANSGSAYKFEIQGSPPPLSNEIDTNQSTNSTGSWVDLASVGPSITIPLTGEYEIRASVTQIATVSGTGQISVWDGVSTTLTPTVPGYLVGAGKANRLVLTIPRVALVRGSVVKVQYQTDTAGWSFKDRILQIFPLRVNQT